MTRAACALVLILAMSGSASGGIDPGLALRMGQAVAGERVAVVVLFASDSSGSGGDLEAAAMRGIRGAAARGEHERGLRQRHADILDRLGPGPDARALTAGRELWIVNARALALTPVEIERIAGLAGVERVIEDAVLSLAPEPAATPATTASASQAGWNLQLIGAPALWDLGIDGQGVTVGLIDTGVALEYPALAGNWRGGANSWWDAFATSAQPVDEGYFDAQKKKVYHGTGVAGIMAGGSSTAGTALGVAPGVRWIAARAWDTANHAMLSDLLAAMQWMLDPDGDPATDDAPDILNNSWGISDPGVYLDTLQQACTVLRSAGVVVVWAAGNEGPGNATSVSPANYPGEISVGYSTSGDFVGSNSSRGPSAWQDALYPLLTAPGENVLTATRPLFSGDNATVTLTGSSFAAPHVAGALALLMQAFPNRPAAELLTALERSAADLAASGPDNDAGHGRIDVLAAWRLLASSPLPGVLLLLGE